jgi:glycerophosphoryl diester phosphodiesterase
MLLSDVVQLLGLFTSLCSAAPQPPHQGRRGQLLPDAVAHRGASGNAPENTMAAFRLAHQLGAAGSETDLHLTRDGVVVILHDVDIRRTTRGWPDDLPSYRIDDLDWEFVATLDAGSWFAPEFAGEPVPRLVDLLDFSAETGMLAYLDVKATATGSAGLAAIRDELLSHAGRGSYEVQVRVH